MPEAVIALPSLPKLIDKEEDQWPAVWRGSAAEFFATMIFVFIGTGAVVACKAELGFQDIMIPSITLISLAHGFAIMVLVYAVGEVSGGHINPAVTWACLITGKISVLRAVIYVFSQLFGAIVGSSVLRSMLPLSVIQASGMGTHSINPDITVSQGFWAETIFTFIFIFVVFSTAISPFAGKFAPLRGDGQTGKSYGPGKLTPFAVGMAILMLHTVGIKLTGASMNPARTFGPSLVNNKWKDQWVYWVGPLFGSTLAAIVAQIIFLSTPRDIFRLNKDTSEKIPDAPVPAMDTVEIKAGKTEFKRTEIPSRPTPTFDAVVERSSPSPARYSSSPARSPQVDRQEPQNSEMHKSGSGQFSAIMQEDSNVVELEDLN